MADQCHKNDAVSSPDSRVIRNGCVPARWNRHADVNQPGQELGYAINPQKTGTIGNFELLEPSQIESSAEKTIICELCPHACRIAPGKSGRCSARLNVDGRLISRFYGKPVSVAIDPIEKKPLYHFLPGTPILSLGTRGCNLSCKFCQNWQISQPFPVTSTINATLEPRQVIELALEHKCPSVAFTYNEPTIWAEYVVDVSRLCRRNGIKTVAVTNGMICGSARREFFNAVDATNIDLKAFTQSFYKNLTGGDLESVKETLKYVAKETDVWLEITNLLIPGHNDSSTELKEMCRWIVDEIGQLTPLHFSAFFPTWRLTDSPPTPLEKLIEATEIAREIGVRYVYRGNVKDDSGQTTYCSRCGSSLIVRSSYNVTFSSNLEYRSFQACCGKCGEPLAGVFGQ